MKDESTILVTGATGNLGRELIPKLISDFRVVGCAREIYKNNEMKDKNFVFEKVDLSLKEEVRKLFKKYKFSQIIHLVALIKRGELKMDEIIAVFESNVISLFNILSQAGKFKKIIFTSSVAVYGIPQSLLIKEGIPLSPLDFYGKCKASCEDLVKHFSQATGSSFAILRIPSIFAKTIKEGAVYSFYKKALSNKDIIINVDKPTPWSIIYIEDAADCIVSAVSKNDVNNETINIGYDDGIELEMIAKKIKKISKSKSKIIKTYDFANPVLYLDTQKIKKLLGLKLPSLDQRLIKYLDDLKINNESR